MVKYKLQEVYFYIVIILPNSKCIYYNNKLYTNNNGIKYLLNQDDYSTLNNKIPTGSTIIITQKSATYNFNRSFYSDEDSQYAFYTLPQNTLYFTIMAHVTGSISGSSNLNDTVYYSEPEIVNKSIYSNRTGVDANDSSPIDDTVFVFGVIGNSYTICDNGDNGMELIENKLNNIYIGISHSTSATSGYIKYNLSIAYQVSVISFT